MGSGVLPLAMATRPAKRRETWRPEWGALVERAPRRTPGPMLMADEGLPRWGGAPGGRKRVVWGVFFGWRNGVPPEGGLPPWSDLGSLDLRSLDDSCRWMRAQADRAISTGQ